MILNNKDIIEKKQCTICGELKPVNTEFFYMRNKKKPELGFVAQCKICACQKVKEYIQQCPENRSEANKKYYDQNKLYAKLRKRRNVAKNPDIYKNNIRNWLQNNKDKVAEYNEKRQHKNHKITKNEWVQCKKYFDYTCCYCGLPLSEHYFTRKGITKLGDFHKEHLDHNGGNDLSNCVPSCGSCNESKWKYTLDEWYNEDNPNFSEEKYNKILQWIMIDSYHYIEQY